MDNKKIVNNISISYLFDPFSEKKEPILIIDLKASVCSFKYEIYSNKGFYLHSSYQKKIEFGSVGNNNNRLIIQLKDDYSESNYFIRLFEVQIVSNNIMRSDFSRNLMNLDRFKNTSENDTENETLLNEPIFYFYTIPEKKNSQQPQEKTNIKLQIDEDDEKETTTETTVPNDSSEKNQNDQ